MTRIQLLRTPPPQFLKGYVLSSPRICFSLLYLEFCCHFLVSYYSPSWSFTAFIFCAFAVFLLYFLFVLLFVFSLFCYLFICYL